MNTAYSQKEYNTFSLNYRVGGEHLFPKPMEDVAQALKFIAAHTDIFGVDPSHYAIGGFSARGNLVCVWGMKQNSYAHYGLPAPSVMFPIYPAINNSMLLEYVSEDPGKKKQQLLTAKSYFTIAYGKHPDKE